jgi:hypothetical protein
MKKLFIVLVALLSVSGLFAKDKRLYEKKTSVSVIELYESTESPKYYISIYEKDIEEGYNNCIVNCNDKDKITEFLQYIINHNFNNHYAFTVSAYEVTHEELQLINKKTEIVKGNFENRTMYLLK